ncbi:MAG: tetratricopeptide repeat protein [Chloroflexi bacterium]|nr:tetratricopeptide repeat protein [Chloroflexota bacterium]
MVKRRLLHAVLCLFLLSLTFFIAGCSGKTEKLAPEETRQLLISAEGAFDRGDQPELRRIVDKLLAADPKNLEALIYQGRLEMESGDGKKALLSFKKAARYHPGNGMPFFWLGKMEMEQGNRKKALKDFKKASKMDDPRVFLALYEIYEDMNMLGEAGAILDRARKLDIKDNALKATIETSLALRCERRDDLRGALEHYRTAYELDPMPEYMAHQAQVLFELEKYEEAEKIFYDILARNPYNYQAILGIGKVYRELGFYDDAIRMLNKIAAGQEKKISAYLLLGNIFLERREYKYAMEFFNRAREMSPDTPDSYLGLAKASIAMGDEKSGLEYLSRMKNLSSFEMADMECQIAGIYLDHLERPSEAVNHYRKVTKIMPENGEGWVGMGRCLLALGDKEAGMKAMEKAQELSRNPGMMSADVSHWYIMPQNNEQDQKPDDSLMQRRGKIKSPRMESAMLLRLADLYLETDKFEEARAKVEDALKVYKPTAHTYSMLGKIALATGDKTGADKYFSSAIKLDPENKDAMLGTAEILSIKGDNKKALAILRKTREIYPWDSETIFVMAEIKSRSGQSDEAAKLLKEAVDIQPRLKKQAKKIPELAKLLNKS